MAGILQSNLLACLFKQVACVLFALEVTDAFGSYDIAGPFASHKMIESA